MVWNLMKELLFLEPVFKTTMWGGGRLRDMYNFSIPDEHTGESWVIGGHTNGDCRVIGGSYLGKRLSELWHDHPELFYNEQGVMGKEFPLLVKIIDAREDLSLQVHPDNQYAYEYEQGALGKTECWYILDCKPNASIIIGHKAKCKEDLENMIKEQRWDDLIREIPIKKGDFFQINPGCVHAIKGGTLVFETQQSSDITYRVYDYDRKEEGKTRQLHLRQSLDVIEAPFCEAEDQYVRIEGDGVIQEHLVHCDYYTVEKYEISESWNHRFYAPFVNVTILEGEGFWNGIAVKKGQSFIIPSGYGNCEITGTLKMICSWPEVKSERPILNPFHSEEMTIAVVDWMGRSKASSSDLDCVVFTPEILYEPGDQIMITVAETDRHYKIRIDDTMDEAMVYLKHNKISFQIPFGEKKKSYNQKSFTGEKHYLTCRKATDCEIAAYRNLAENVMDQHGEHGCYPHAHANVETRGESVFAARNAIDGMLANRDHGSWPFESWGINQQEDAEYTLEFGRPVDIGEIVLWTRADFPHDNWWEHAVLWFSDGSREEITMKKSEKPHRFLISKKKILWIKLGDLIKSDDPSPFPALTQIQVYGTES